MPSGLQDGQMIDLFGQAVPHASHSAQQVNKRAKMMSATCSPHGSASSASAALQQSLESRLQQLLPTGGLTMFIKGWKQKATPLGRRYCQLAVLGRPTAETACGLWPTPQARDHMPAHTPEYVAAKKALGHGMANLNDVVAAALWATPRSCEYKGAGPKVMRNDGKLRNDTLMFQVERFGPERIGPNAQTGNIGSLHPAFPCWLMGFRTANLSSMLLAMRLFRK